MSKACRVCALTVLMIVSFYRSTAEAVRLDLLFFRINESSLEVSVDIRSETTDSEANLDILSLAETQAASVLLLHFCQNAQFSSAD